MNINAWQDDDIELSESNKEDEEELKVLQIKQSKVAWHHFAIKDYEKGFEILKSQINLAETKEILNKAKEISKLNEMSFSNEL